MIQAIVEELPHSQGAARCCMPPTAYSPVMTMTMPLQSKGLRP